jgi:hypothetical protein
MRVPARSTPVGRAQVPSQVCNLWRRSNRGRAWIRRGSYLLVINVAPWLGGTLPSLGASLIVYVGLTQLGRALSR